MHRILLLLCCFLFYSIANLATGHNCVKLTRDSLDNIPNNYKPLVTTTTEGKEERVPIVCKSDSDCSEFSINDSANIGTANKVICDLELKICIVGLVIDDETSTITPSNTTDINSNVTRDEIEPDSDRIDNIRTIPIAVWISFTIPFISIIVLGIICGRRLKHQSESIQNNLQRTTIHGVHVENILSQQEQQIISAIAFTPPPTYEKATGEIPPSYETFLQALESKRLSIFDCDSLMNKPSNTNTTLDQEISSISSGNEITTTTSIPSSPNLLTVPRNTFR